MCGGGIRWTVCVDRAGASVAASQGPLGRACLKVSVLQVADVQGRSAILFLFSAGSVIVGASFDWVFFFV